MLTLIVLLGCAASLCAQSSNNEKDRTKGTITGRVVNESGQPIANAMVNIRGYGGNQGQIVAVDAEGNFRATDLAPIAYQIVAEAPGYVSRPRDPDINPIGYYRAGDSVRLEMMKGGVITGVVTRANGEPVVAVQVRAHLIRDYKGQPVRYSRPSGWQQTDDRGIYRMYGLVPGTYLVSAGGGEGGSYRVEPFATDAPTFAPSSTRDSAAEITVNSGEEISNIDIRCREEPGHSVSGSAVSSSSEERSFQLALISDFRGMQQVSYNAYQNPMARGFMFSGVVDGDYQIVAQNYSPVLGWFISEPQRITVKGADITGVELSLKPLASMSGSVVLEESKVPACQGKHRPVVGETVIAAWHNEKKEAKDQPQFVWGLGGPATPDQQGTFRLRNLAAGQYRFVTRPLAKYWYLKSIAWPTAAPAVQANKPLDAAKNWTTLKSGDSYSGLTITFAAGAASIEGRVESSSGQELLPRTFVYLTPAEPDKREDVLRYFVSLVDAASFSFSNVPPGRYWIVAKGAAESDTNMLSKLRLPDEAVLRARILREAENEKAETELKPCQNVTDYRLTLRPE